MQSASPNHPAIDSRTLAVHYVRAMAIYLGLMYTLWLIGLEGIYAHPTPFYALFFPSVGLPVAVALTILLLLAGYCLFFRKVGGSATPFVIGGLVILGAGVGLGVLQDGATGETDSAASLSLIPRLAWQVPSLLVAVSGGFALRHLVLPALAPEREVSFHEMRRVLWGIFAFSILFACAIAMIRGGFQGIDQAYARSAYEYAGDIGKTRDIRTLFADYLKIHEHLSMHAKVHPPGPIALLWMLSNILNILLVFIPLGVTGSSPMALSLATVVFSSLAVFPLYGWTKRLAGQRAAIIACLCYVVVPSVTLFTATSADALFTPFTLSALYCFERSIRTRSGRFALAAGVFYGCMILLKFSLIGIGAYFGLVGLWMLRRAETRLNVVITASLMILGVGAVLGGVYWWSGYNVYENFLVAKAQFDTDQYHLDELTPRLPAWTYRVLNPACWFYFAGIPLSLLFIRELCVGDKKLRPEWIIFFLTLIVLNLLYLARGEGERSALYLIPFVLIPASAWIERNAMRLGDASIIYVTLAFLAFQTWFTETYFYTYW